ncbi:uncharacterized protein CTRU02_206648 [Colletotrichum truncatum]|uniref:Uncharacterized protein n=1 Tax=Colletotrichum truncatum TaxID=5467 RepID=A0ACC3Z7G2_COLTU|nr:uncharacterized protein CTRU02_13769 [Colletotrichum truncatum]KAF6782943.1 hypothetical protein CTRU02_13769 [Colletotrichum truncatum]
MRRAEAAWARSVKQRHEMIATDYGSVDKMPLPPGREEEPYLSHPYTIWDFTPASFAAPFEMERVGRLGDGGKWVCGMSCYSTASKARPIIIYSLGVGQESSFENEMLSRTNCEIWGFDMSVDDWGDQLDESNRGRAHFLKAGAAGQTDTSSNPPYYSVQDAMKKNGHDYVDILKMDIETFEFEVLDSLIGNFSAEKGLEVPIGQILVEIHLQRPMDVHTYLEWFERLEARGLRPVWTEPNLLGVTLGISHKAGGPILSEYTFININDSRSAILGGLTAKDIQD